MLNYVQVNVNVDGRIHSVDATTVQVVRRNVVPVAELEGSDPLNGTKGWRPIIDLDDAVREGLVHAVSEMS
jgi:hypothetical protein